MNKIILNLTQISEFVFSNKYQLNKDEARKSRCIDGRYENSKASVFGFPGADAGIVTLVVSAAKKNGYDFDLNKIWQAVCAVVGGEEKIQFHTDSHAEKGKTLGGCGHYKQMTLTPEDYGLTANEVEEIRNKFAQTKEKGAIEVILEGDHKEAAVVFIKGDFGIYPQGEVVDEEGKKTAVQIFIYHQTLAEAYLKDLARLLLEKKAIVFRDSETEEMLSTALLEMADIHLLETAKRLAKGLPIFEVKFEEDGQFKIEEMGSV